MEYNAFHEFWKPNRKKEDECCLPQIQTTIYILYIHIYLFFWKKKKLFEKDIGNTK
jgi:hypothetical protein